MSCSPISAGATFSCPPSQGGIYAKLWLVPYSDFKDSTTAVTRVDSDSPITAITLPSGGKQWYLFEAGKAAHIVPTIALRAVDGGTDGYDHSVDTRVFDVSQSSRNNLATMRFAKVVAIVQKVDGTGMVLGYEQGLLMSDYQENLSDASVSNLINFIVKTPDSEAPEINAGENLDSTFDFDALTTPTAE